MLKIIVNGAPRAGKDSFVNACLKEVRGACISSVDRVKQAAALLGWDGAKDGRGRQFLSDLKDISTRVYDGPMRYMQQIIEESEGADALFFMIREPEEIARFVALYPDAITVCVVSGRAETYDNHADLLVSNYLYDWYVPNHGTLDDLRYEAKRFVLYATMGVRP